ncbi:MAG: arylesterase [Opitutaceae bacterium]|jgi:acyl-CoA thioesterase-1
MKPLFSLLFLLFLAGTTSAATSGTGTKTVLFFGDSLTAGYGLEDASAQSFPAVIQQKIAAAGLPWRVVNAGLSGETSAGGLRRIDWILRAPVDVFVLELGANDGLRGLPLDAIRNNLQAIIDRVRAKNPSVKIVVAGMKMPVNLGDYANAFADIFPTLAKANQAALIPFLLENVAARPELNQPDGIHPTAEGARLVADTAWKTLEPLLSR